MKLVFLSNYYNHHQAPICEKWCIQTNNDFYFVETELFSQERKKLGWEICQQPFVVQYKSENDGNISELINQADVVIWGNAPECLVKKQLTGKKIVFKYSERVFKRGYNPWKWFPRVLRYWYFYGRHKSLYLLCASAYTFSDYARHGTFIGKSYKWGYFPKTKYYDIPELFSKKRTHQILWCGRFLDWKHPDDALEVAKRLKNENYEFEMILIGTGEMEMILKNDIEKYHLENNVKILGPMKSETVRHYMENAGIYLSTSDFQEGWGAVINEAMNSGCAVVASHAMGSVPFLLKHGENGLIYESGRIDGLYKKVKYLLEHPEKQRFFGENAYCTIVELWNENVAAQRFQVLAEQIMKTGKCDLYADGPCSRAEIIRNDWFKEENSVEVSRNQE